MKGYGAFSYTPEPYASDKFDRGLDISDLVGYVQPRSGYIR
jgi:hypothetical protein